jgi:hypothetical protein
MIQRISFSLPYSIQPVSNNTRRCLNRTSRGEEDGVSVKKEYFRFRSLTQDDGEAKTGYDKGFIWKTKKSEIE